MTQSPEFLAACNNVKSQLSRAIVTPLDVENFIRLLNHNPVDPHSLQDLISVIDPLIIRDDYYQLDPQLLIIELLQLLLSKISFEQILEFYPLQFILENLHQNNHFSLLILKVLTTHGLQVDWYDHDLLYRVVSNYLLNKDLTINIASQTQTLLSSLPDPSMLNQPNFQSLFQSVKANGDSVLTSRLLDMITQFSPRVNFDLEFPLDLNDELFALLVINFYENLLDKQSLQILRAISSKVDEIVGLFGKRKSDETVQMFLVTDIINFLAKLSFKFPQEFPLTPLLNPVNLYLDTSYDIQLLSKINPDVMPFELLEYLIEFPLFNQKYFAILLNIVTLESVLKFLIDHDKISSNTLLTLTIDYLYRALVNLCNSKFGVSYLINNCPAILNDYIIDNIPTNSDIFALKLSLLEKLLFQDHDLLIWHNRLMETYKTMKYGRAIRADPQVDILDDVG